MLVVKNGVDPISATLAETEILDHHLHNIEHWFGAGMTEDSLTGYTLTSGNGDFGTEVLLLDTTDTPILTGRRFFDLHRLMVDSVSDNTLYIVRLVYGTGTHAAAVSAHQYSALPILPAGTGANIRAGATDIKFPRQAVGTKVWGCVKSAVNLATIDIQIGVHEYFD